MKLLSILSIPLLIITLLSCTKEKEVVPEVIPPVIMPPVVDPSFDVTKATLLSQGAFAGSGGYVVNGTAKLYEYLGKKYMYLENLVATNGPDLKVYIATNTSAAQFVSLGPLLSNSGSKEYLIAVPPDFMVYNKVLIWCQQFSVLFGSATLS